MYGVPANLDPSSFGGAELIQICVGQFQWQFHFHPRGYISIERNWELHDAGGKLIDRFERETPREDIHIHVLLGKKVAGFSVDAPHSFSLIFQSGHTLRICDDLGTYESFFIQPGNIVV